MRLLTSALAALAAVCAPAIAGAQDVSARFEPVLAPLVLHNWNPIETTVCAGGDGAFVGSVELGADGDRRVWSRDVRVAAGSCSSRIDPVFVDRGQLSLRVLDADGRQVVRADENHRAVVQAAVAVLSGPLVGFARARAVQVAILEPTAGAPALPSDPLAWHAVGAVLVTEARWAELPAPVRDALERWVDVGGILVLAAHEDGASRRQGLGRVDRLDLRTADASARLDTVYEDVYRRWSVAARPGLLESGVFYAWQGAGRLDVSGRRVPPVSVVAAILLSAVLAVSALGSARVRRRLGSTGLLVGAPAIGGLGFCAIVGLGFSVKGGEPVFRSLGLVEAGAGAHWASAQRVVGLLATHAGMLRVRGRPGALLLPLHDVAGDRSWGRERIRLADRKPTELEVPAGLWQTTYLREDALVPIGEGIDVSRERADEPFPLRIDNGTPFVLRDVVLVEPGERRIALGTIRPGEARTAVAPTPGATDAGLPFGWSWTGARASSPEGRNVLVARLDPSALPDLPGTRAEDETLFLRVELP